MHAIHVLLVISLVWEAKGHPAPKEASNPELEDDEAIVSELARRLRPIESLESKQRRLEEFEARQNMLNNLESNHHPLDGAESHYGCGGGCSKGKVRSKVSEDLEAEYLRGMRGGAPRPIFGLLNDILETARYGYRFDSPRAHIVF